MKIVKQNNQSLKEVVDFLNSGGVVICPTDTVYGFLADLSNKKAVKKIYKIKNRLRSKPLPVFVKDVRMAKSLAEISDNQEKIIKKYWPGKYTFILKSKNCNSKTKNTIALRIPDHKFLNDLLKKINKPLAQTSVNISDCPPLTKIDKIIKIFGSMPGLDLIINAGNLPKREPSKIIDLTSECLTRLR